MILYTRDEMKHKSNSKKSFLFLIPFILLFAVIFNFPKETKAAEDCITVKEINYKNSSITLQVNSGDTILYFSDSLKKTWDIVPGKINSNHTIVMDISWISLSKNYVMTFKGNSSTGITTVVIPKEATSFRASYNKLNSTISFSNAGLRITEWRKKDSTIWNTVNNNTLSNELSNLYTNGATIYFRLAPINGTSNTNVGCRASKEVSVSIPKKIVAPKVSIDGSKLLIAAKKGIAYRTVNKDGSVTAWEILKSNEPLLSDIAPNVMYSNNTSLQEEVTLQFRSNATSVAQLSNITTITVPIQEGPLDEDKYGISLSYNSSTTLSLQVKAASSEAPYEYTIIKRDNDLIYQTASWTVITSKAVFNINKKAAPEGSHIYIRKKSVAASEEVEFSLASAEIDITGTNGISYPEAPKVNSIATLITTAGVCNADNSSGYLTFTLYSPTQTTVTSIDFHDAYGIKKGSVTSKSSVSVNTNSSTDKDKYIITTRITSTDSIDADTNEILYAYITLANADTIISTSTTGIQLYLYPKTIVNNPNSSDYTGDFKRIYLSNNEDDASNLKFKLNFGTDKVIDTSAINRYTADATAVSSIFYKGYQLIKDTDYSLEYGSYLDEDRNTIATVTVTVNVAAFENSIPRSDLDQKIPIIIKLNNNEILDDNVYITLVSTATVDNIPIAWSIMEGSLKETKTSTVANPSGGTSTVTEEVITYTINLALFDKFYEVGISDVTWGGTSILGSASVSSGKATIYLSNAKINKLTTSSTDTKNIVITLSNGFVINSGCKLTIIKAS